MSKYRIQTTDEKRRAFWDRYFGVEELPVKYERPRYQELPGKTVLAYDLDTSRLASGAVYNFAHYLARKYRTSYDAARKMVDGYPISAANTKLLDETAQPPTWWRRPFSFSSNYLVSSS